MMTTSGCTIPSARSRCSITSTDPSTPRWRCVGTTTHTEQRQAVSHASASAPHAPVSLFFLARVVSGHFLAGTCFFFGVPFLLVYLYDPASRVDAVRQEFPYDSLRMSLGGEKDMRVPLCADRRCRCGCAARSRPDAMLTPPPPAARMSVQDPTEQSDAQTASPTQRVTPLCTSGCQQSRTTCARRCRCAIVSRSRRVTCRHDHCHPQHSYMYTYRTSILRAGDPYACTWIWIRELSWPRRVSTSCRLQLCVSSGRATAAAS